MNATSSEDRAVLDANRALLEGLIARDVESLRALLADDFVAVHITGQEQSKADWLQQIRSGRMSYHDFDEKSARVTVNGDRAVLVTRYRVLATIWGSRNRWSLESTTTYARRNGEWLITRSAASTY